MGYNPQNDKFKLELITNFDMFIFFQKYRGDGIFCISNRYSKGNNKYLKSYDLKQESKHIFYLDANSLYCYVMPKFLPKSEFKWIDPKEFDLNKYTSNSLAPEKLEVKREMLCKFQLKIIDLYKISTGNVKSWCITFFDKESMCFIMTACNFPYD